MWLAICNVQIKVHTCKFRHSSVAINYNYYYYYNAWMVVILLHTFKRDLIAKC